MRRQIEKILQDWQSKSHRKPLILRGARQVGKTYLIENFSKNNFKEVVKINFELEPEYKPVFKTLRPVEIVRNLGLTTGKNIKAGECLIFLDEIQECPEAITALRYFHEQMPEQHVIAAGSLLEFTLNSPDFHMPVGRVESLFIKPLTFMEFLQAAGHDNLVDFLNTLTAQTKINPAVHERLLRHFREYLLIGGMPEVVSVYLEDSSSIAFQNIQTALLQGYRDDFGKYARRSPLDALHKVYQTAPAKVGGVYKYSHIDRDMRSAELKHALNLLVDAGLVTKIHSTSGHGLPFIKDVNERKFKILFLDVGLVQRACGLDAQIALSDDFNAINAGAVSEQVVGQLLLANKNPHERPELYFWSREEQNSQAEIDYLMAIDGHVIPVEVKSGKTGRLRSLRLFLDSHKTHFGIRFASLPLSYHDQILTLPLYAVEMAEKIAQNLLKK